MLQWNDILRLAEKGNLKPDYKLEMTDADWKAKLSPEVYAITRQKGTERAFSSEMCGLFEEGLYACACCNNLLFNAQQKFDSGSGWPSFTETVKDNAIAYHIDLTHGMQRVETTCNVCDAHLGHVFPDGPKPTGLRYCMNALALKKTSIKPKEVTFGGGCFWCTEALFQDLDGVISVQSGYSGGAVQNPTYEAVTTGSTGHAEVIQITYDPTKISYKELLRLHLATHDPTTLNRQGADRGTQYRSIIFYRSPEEKIEAEEVVNEMQVYWSEPIVTQLAPFVVFYEAEDYHQNYYKNNSDKQYCQIVIEPKLRKFRAQLQQEAK